MILRNPNLSPLTAADLVARLGPMPLDRICFNPMPGTATEDDLLARVQEGQCLLELSDGILVEKAMGYAESVLALALAGFLRSWIAPRNLGVLAGADGMMRLAPGLVRIPDISFVPWDRFPNRQVSLTPIPHLFPDLAVEVLSSTNTPQEMEQKLRDYFASGAALVWFVNPEPRWVDVYTSPTERRRLTEADTLDGGAVLPGFALPLQQLFAELDPH
jgi:Uma2 family endonuclease